MTTVCLTFDFDAFSLWLSTLKQTTASPLSRGEYSARVGIVRVLDMLKGQGIRATFFVPGHTAISFPEQVRRIAEEGHEVASHGFCHESPVSLSQDQEADLLRRGMERLRGVLGHSFQPLGYRSPAFDLSDHSVEILEDQGYVYDSSLMADDFSPYHPRCGDRITEEAFVAGRPSRLIEFPVSWELDDYPYFHFLTKPINQGLRSPDDVLAVWRDEFDYCDQAVEDGVFTLTNHPEIIGRGPRICMLERLVEHMKSRSDVAFRTLGEEARRRLDRTIP